MTSKNTTSIFGHLNRPLSLYQLKICTFQPKRKELMKQCKIFLIFALTISGLMLTSPAQSNSSYTLYDLGALDGFYTFGKSVNNNGQVAGHSGLSGEKRYTFIAHREGFTKLGPMKSDRLGINNNGVVSGFTADLSFTDGTQGAGLDINDNSQTTGWFEPNNNSSTQHAFINDNRGLIDLGTLGGEYSYGTGINNKGQVTGVSDTNNENSHAFIGDSNGITELGTLGGSHSFGFDINNNGQVTGIAYTSNELPHAFVGDSNGLHDLGTLGGAESEGNGISDDNQIVGQSVISDESTNHAFLWNNTEGMLDLNELASDLTGWEYLISADGISDNGKFITGSGLTTSGQVHAFLLTSVPIPATAWLFFTALLGLKGIAIGKKTSIKSLLH